MDVAALSLESLQREFRGEIFTPTSSGYDAARRIWNAMIDRRPAAIARCTCTEDVTAAVRFATREGLHPAIRGGGHNAAGLAMVDDGLVIDMSLMKEIVVDPVARRPSRGQASTGASSTGQHRRMASPRRVDCSPPPGSPHSRRAAASGGSWVNMASPATTRCPSRS
jgi:hypothetical protein